MHIYTCILYNFTKYFYFICRPVAVYEMFCFRQAGVVYLGSLSRPDTHAAIMSSVALVNSSLSEGNSIAILEVCAWLQSTLYVSLEKHAVKLKCVKSTPSSMKQTLGSSS